MSLSSWLKECLLATVSRATGRHAVLLPALARDEACLLPVRTTYRVEAPALTLDLIDAEPGRLHATLLGYDGHFPTRPLWAAAAECVPPCTLVMNLQSGGVELAGQVLGHVPLPLPGRRFCWRLELTRSDGKTRSRTTGHYVPGDGRDVEQSYFQGENYVDYEAQSAGDHAVILDLLKAQAARGPVLDVGCATGVLMAALEKAGFATYGIDFSAWAIDRAAQRLGSDRAFVGDLSMDGLPEPLASRGPFGTLLLWNVLEHFADPFGVAARLGKAAAPGAALLINTTNADSLSHQLFGRQWEGHFDWTHQGVERVSVRSLREELPRLGWRVAQLTTYLLWDLDADPTRATLREWYGADARFRRLLSERDLGDMLTCVAVKQT